MLLSGTAASNTMFAPAAVGQVIYSVVVTLFRSWVARIWGHSTRSTLLVATQVEELALVTVVLLRDAQLHVPNFGVLDHDLETAYPHRVAIIGVIGPYGRDARRLVQLPCLRKPASWASLALPYAGFRSLTFAM